MLFPVVSGSFRLSRDRRSLFFIRSGRPARLISRNLETRGETEAFIFPTQTEVRAWDITDSALFYVEFDYRFSTASLISVDLASGARQVLASLPVVSAEYWQPAISAAPAGHSVNVTQIDRVDAKLMSIRLPRLL